MKIRFLVGLIFSSSFFYPTWLTALSQEPYPALDALGVEKSDIGGREDSLPPPFVLPPVRNFLYDPLGRFSEAQDVAESVLLKQADSVRAIEALEEFCELHASTGTHGHDAAFSTNISTSAPAWLSRAVENFWRETTSVRDRVRILTEALTKEERRALSEEIGSLYWDAERSAESEKPDRREVVRRQEIFSLMEKISLGDWMAASRAAAGAAAKLRETIEGHRDDFSGISTHRFRLGNDTILVGGVAPDSHKISSRDVLVIDFGGNDAYRGVPASGQDGRLAVLLDLSGDDSYVSTASFSLGGGHWGVGVLFDARGDDIYRAPGRSIGAGLLGAGVLIDAEGDDVYVARNVALGAGVAGFGFLSDLSGDDSYRVGRMGQGFGGVAGVGALVDGTGNDQYFSGALWADPREPTAFHGMSQGFAMGIRDYTGGGVGALFDGAGHDSYVGDYFGQGASYWYSLGMLYDREGRDTYSSRRYVQGAGVHASVGLLLDVLGDDMYTAWGAGQGMGWDDAVGILVDQSGSDRYVSDWGSQGMGGVTAVGLFADNGGADSYTVTPNHGQGYGVWDDRRRAPSVSVFLDGGGTDRYPDSAREGGVWNVARWGLGTDIPSPFPLRLRENVPVPAVDKHKEQLAEERVSLEKRLAKAETLNDPLLRVSETLAVAGHWGLDEETPREARRRLLRLTPDEILPPLTAAMDARQTMAYLLQEEFYLRQGPAAIPALIGRLENMEVRLATGPASDHRNAVRETALSLYYLGQTGSPAAEAAVARRLDHSAVQVRTAAARALGEIFDRRLAVLAEQLRERLRETARGRLRKELREFLAGMSYGERLRLIFELQPLAWKEFRRLMEPSITGQHAGTIDAWAAFVYGRRERLPALLRGREKIQISSTTLAALRNALSDPSAAVRHAAAVSLGRIGDEQTMDEVAALLSDPESRVRYAAAWALGQQGNSVRDLLIEKVQSDSVRERKSALEALAHSADPDARLIFETSLRDSDWSVRYRALDLLWRERAAFYPASIGVPDESLGRTLQAVIDTDGHPWVHAKAKSFLAEWKRGGR